MEPYCPVCNYHLPTIQTLSYPEAPDVTCPGCERVWYFFGADERYIATRPKRVRMTKIPEVGDKITDVLKPE